METSNAVSAVGFLTACCFALLNLGLLAITIAFPVCKYTTHTAPFTEWTDVQVFAPLIAIGAMNVAVFCCACCCGMCGVAAAAKGDTSKV